MQANLQAVYTELKADIQEVRTEMQVIKSELQHEIKDSEQRLQKEIHKAMAYGVSLNVGLLGIGLGIMTFVLMK